MSNRAWQMNLSFYLCANASFQRNRDETWRIIRSVNQSPVTHLCLSHRRWNVTWMQIKSRWTDSTCDTPRVQNHRGDILFRLRLALALTSTSLSSWLVFVRKKVPFWPPGLWPFGLVLRILVRCRMSKGSAIMMLCASLMNSQFYHGSKKPSLRK